MSKQFTTRDIQRATFVESLHSSLKKQASIAIADSNRFMKLACSYIEDGLNESECIELLMIDGLSREASESYLAMASSNEVQETDGLHDYSFQFEDSYGKIYSSYDIGKVVRASNDSEAWEKAEIAIDTQEDLEAHTVISISRID